MLKKLVSIISILCLGAIANASITITPFTGEDNYFYYDVDVVLEGDKYVEGFGQNSETERTYYEWIYITPSAYGADYSFINFSNSLQGSDGSTTDTQLLLYDSENHPSSDRVILNGPQIYNNSATFGFGGGQTNSVEGSGLFADDGPFNASLALNEEQYVVVFTSFRPDALGSMDIEIHGPNSLNFATIPEPTSFALMIAFGGFLYIAIRKRHA
tara:strand:- start:90 stop:731 length:642 start_codon:yes stop_codon:yes gene_type:complete